MFLEWDVLKLPIYGFHQLQQRLQSYLVPAASLKCLDTEVEDQG